VRAGSQPTAAMPPPEGAAANPLYARSDLRVGLVAVETLVFGGLLPGALVWFSRGQSQHFVLPLLVFFPLLLGLRYGFVAGSLGAALTAAAVAWMNHLNPAVLGDYPKAQAVALLLAGMAAGEARDLWNARMRQLDYICRYHQTRLQQFTGAYQALQVSHAQLERRMVGGVTSLRTALERLRLREPAAGSDPQAPLGGLGDWLLEIMADAGSLHTAAVYALNDRGVLRLPAVAMIGQAAELSPFNPLLRETLRTGALTSVHAGNEAAHEPVIAVVPLVDATGHIHGVVSISDMPFLNIHQETFELLGVLGRHIGDILARRTRPAGELLGFHALRYSLQRNVLDVKKHGLPAALLACKIVDAARSDALVAHCCHDSRGLDQSWISRNRKGQPVVVKILPMTDEAGVKRFLARLESGPPGATGAKGGIITYLWMLDKHHTADDLLSEIAAACDIETLGGGKTGPPEKSATAVPPEPSGPTSGAAL
jgi:hypothetical protein